VTILGHRGAALFTVIALEDSSLRVRWKRRVPCMCFFSISHDSTRYEGRSSATIQP
jgi:hypothetical protein